MAKNSTRIYYDSFSPAGRAGISRNEKNMKGKAESSDPPDEAVIRNILGFSKALKIKKSGQIGLIELLLN